MVSFEVVPMGLANIAGGYPATPWRGPCSTRCKDCVTWSAMRGRRHNVVLHGSPPKKPPDDGFAIWMMNLVFFFARWSGNMNGETKNQTRYPQDTYDFVGPPPTQSPNPFLTPWPRGAWKPTMINHESKVGVHLAGFTTLHNVNIYNH